MKIAWVLVLALAACGRSGGLTPGGGGGGGDAAGGGSAGGSVAAGGGAPVGDCQITWDTTRIVNRSEDGGDMAYRPICGDPTCLPITVDGHPGPGEEPPSSTCDRPPAKTTAQCGATPSCDCLLPLLMRAEVWPYSRWNCWWFCTPSPDGGVDLLTCDPP